MNSLSTICFALAIGYINASLRPKIIGGKDTDIRHFPYTASLRIKAVLICGGTIISDQHILTAAHCITRYNDIVPPYVHVRIHTGTSSSVLNGNSHRIQSILVHPEWRDTQESVLTHDIAVITLIDKMIFDETQQKIELASENIVSDTVGTLTGWGHTVPINGKNSVQLQKLSMIIFTNTDCQPYHVVTICHKQFCAFHSAGHGSCFGDSGGPLVLDDRVVGVLSWGSDDGRGGCYSGTAEVFTNVYAYRDFIRSAMR